MWPFSKANPETVRVAAVNALQCQTGDIEILYSKAGRGLSEVLETPSALLFLFGFVDYFALKNRITKKKERVDLAISVFRRVFGDIQGIRMFGALQLALRVPNAQTRMQEGFNAARYFEADGLKLVSAYFKGRLENGDENGDSI